MRSNFNEKGEFRFGKSSYEKARKTAENCAKFKLDNDEEEMACGGEISCYDCAFRRWSAESFICVILFSAIKNRRNFKI
ncbi:molybdopterin biosynthesis protein MoeB [uncultured Campylobacter sp.]|uniref:molybdopterin biosynthesis protein MoeB n=1 Tax=uncultured Campylobacter sp. TaxID=218934 RepID=UPI0026038DE5|nr:molybdopterin biosynthesis protein MoeB [uncultured Campylobacter sp.]